MFRKDEIDTFTTIFGSQHINEKTGRRVFKQNGEDTYEKIFGQHEPLYIGQCVEEEQDTFRNVLGIKRQAKISQCHC